MARAKTKPAQEVVGSTVQAEAPAATTAEPVQLTVNDLQVLARIVDLASRRGAFQAAELKQVGEAYEKLASFLAFVESSQKKEEPAGTPAV